MAASTRRRPRRGTNASSLPSLATYSGSRPSSPQASRTSAGIGNVRSSSAMPTPAVLAISLSVAATPPRVGSRSTCTSAPVSSMAATSPCSGAVSLATVVPNSSPSRQLITATPCTPMSPLTMTTSPTRGALRTDVDALVDQSDPRGVDEDAVAAAGVDHLGVPGDQLHAGRQRGRADGLGDAGDVVERGALLEDERGRQHHGLGTGHRQVVDRSVDREVADRCRRGRTSA